MGASRRKIFLKHYIYIYRYYINYCAFFANMLSHSGFGVASILSREVSWKTSDVGKRAINGHYLSIITKGFWKPSVPFLVF